MLRLLSKKTFPNIQHISSSLPSLHCPWSALGRQTSSFPVPRCRNFTSFSRTRAQEASVTCCNIRTPSAHRTLTRLCSRGNQSPSGFTPQCRLLLPSAVPQHGQVRPRNCRQQESIPFSGVTCFQYTAMTTSASKEERQKDQALSAEDEKMRSNLREVFLTAVESVLPRPMLEKVSHINCLPTHSSELLPYY